ncbi:MAG: maleylpyruvate isomerase family mycothiol-dependent enzyme [Microthrixaceae bacterium]
MLDVDTVATVLDVLRPEREALLATLASLDAGAWAAPTECPAYSVKGVAAHILGDDLSLLSRQRDGAENGLLQVAAEMPGADFRALLDTFNDRWVAASKFLSTDLVIELLRLTGEWTAAYYEEVDPAAPGEPVGFFGAQGSSSPFWHAIAREYVERWVHHSQIRRAVGLGSLNDRMFLTVGTEVVAAAARVEPRILSGPDGTWALGSVVLGSAHQAANILTRAHTRAEIQRLVTGPSDAVELLATLAARS